jgi:protein-disulfide isomerase
MKRSLLLAAAAALALTGCQKPAADADFGAKVQDYLYAHPEVVEIAMILRVAESNAPRVAKYRQQIAADPRDLVINPKGAITIVEFFDYRCGYCKLVAPEVTKLIRENPDVRFVFKEMPIFGEVSDTAARMALTSQGKAKGKGLVLYQALMADKGLDQAALDRHISAAGLDPAATRAAAASPAIQAQINDTHLLAQALRIEGTPAFVVGDLLIPSANIPAVEAALEEVRDKGPAGEPAES